MRRFTVVTLLPLLFAGSLLADNPREQERSGRSKKVWLLSVIAVAAANFADVHSTWARVERNPALRSADGRFGYRGAIIKSSMAGGTVLTQFLILRRVPSADRLFTGINFGQAAAFSAIAAHNYGTQKPK